MNKRTACIIGLGLRLSTLEGIGQVKSPSVIGNCNGTATGSNITVTVKCEPSVSKADAKKLARENLEILRKIRDQKLSFDQVINKLDSIQSGVDNLRSEVGPRNLSQAEIEELRQIATQIPANTLVLTYAGSDQETDKYASQFNQGLQLVSPYLFVVGTYFPSIVGIHLTIPAKIEKSGREPKACALLRAFFDREKIPYNAEVGGRTTGAFPKQFETPTCELQIGSKPIP